MTDSLDQILQTEIQKHQLFHPDDSLLIAISGGIDSMSLLHAMLHIHNGRIEVAHMNYHLRSKESDLDEALIREYCQKKGLVLHIKNEALNADSSGIQQKARKLRYKWFNDLTDDNNLKYILTAHHFNDQMETILHHWVRGTGIAGLTGMRHKAGKIVRPMLSISKETIQQYQAKHRIPFRTDSSNKKSYYTRNYLRNEVIPVLRQQFEDLDSGIRTSLHHLADDHSLLQDLLIQWASVNIVREGNYWSLPYTSLDKVGNSENLLYHIFEQELNKEEVRQLLMRDQAGSLIQKEGYDILAARDKLVIRPFKMKKVHIPIEETGIYELPIGYISIEEKKEVLISRNPYEECIPFRKDLFPLTLRNWEMGDRFSPLGMEGNSKKLSDFFIDEKLHQFQKEDTPVLVDKKGQIIWVVGMRLDDHFKVESGEEKFLSLKYSSRPHPFSKIFKYFP